MEYTLDATNQSLGRLASKIAVLLRGKTMPQFKLHTLPSHRVIVRNTDKISISDKKLNQKIYYRHTGYPGGIKSVTMRELFKRDSRLLLKNVVRGMLPKNTLRNRILKRLIMYK